MNFIKYCSTCHPSDTTVSKDAGTVATSALAIWQSVALTTQLDLFYLLLVSFISGNARIFTRIRAMYPSKCLNYVLTVHLRIFSNALSPILLYGAPSPYTHLFREIYFAPLFPFYCFFVLSQLFL
jgi:hypothetical protein